MGLDLKTDRPTLDWQRARWDELEDERKLLHDFEGRAVFELNHAFRNSPELADAYDEMLEDIMDRCSTMRARLDTLEEERCPDRREWV